MDFVGKRGCGSKPFASRLSRFPVVFVGCVVISLLSLLDFGRRLDLSLLDFGRRLLSRVTSLSDFGRRLRCLSGFGRRLCREVICFFVSAWGPFLIPFPFPFSPTFCMVSLFPFPLFVKALSQLFVLVLVEL